MTKLPVISAKEIIRALAKIGYHIDHQKGSVKSSMKNKDKI